MDIVIPETVKCASWACRPLLGSFSEFFKLKRNFETLLQKMERLACTRTDMLLAINTARLEGNKITALASKWVEEVEDFQREANPMMVKFLDDVFVSEACNLKCCTVRRYRLSKAVIKKLHEVDRLLSSGDFQIDPINGQSFTKAVEWMPTTSLDGQEMARDQLKQLMDFSNAENTNIIAVWGMPGVGKTTFVRNFNNMLASSSNSEVFDMVIWVHSARDLDLESVQSHIAKRMNYKLEAGYSVEQKASKLYQRLSAFKHVMIIFDDVWAKIDLDTVGIPYRLECCKVLVIANSYTVCREMKADAVIKVCALCEKAAWDLFVQQAGPVVKLRHISPSARKILSKCGGLPFAIKNIGRSMRGKTKIELWNDAVNQICRAVPHFESFEKDYIPTLQLSINYLPQVYRSCLHYCSLYPENFSIKISELVNCWYADGLIDEYPSLEEVVNSGIAIVDYLKDACMLDGGEGIGTVRMHGLLQNAFMKMLSQEMEGGFFCRPATCLLEVQDKLNASCQRLCLMDNLNTKLPCLQGFPESTVFFVQNRHIWTIPDEVFRELKALKLLNVSGTSIKTLPDSVCNLKELRVFLMRDCHSLERMPPLGDLLNIRILDLSGTRLCELPKGLGKLTSLISLDLSSTYHLKSIEFGIISGLSSLQSLDMSYSAFKWQGRLVGEYQSASIDELVSLQHLSNLHLTLDLEAVTNQDYFLSSYYALFERLRRFTVWVSPKKYGSNIKFTQDDDKRIILISVDISTSGIEALISLATSLALSACGSINFLFKRRNISRLSNLKLLVISSCLDMRNLVDADGIGQSMPPNLEHLKLYRLKNLETILCGSVTVGGMFKQLRTLKVVECHKLKNLVPYSLLLHLQSIERIKVKNCRRLKAIFTGIVPDNAISNLKFLKLENLVGLRCISSSTCAWKNLETLEVSDCPELTELPFTEFNVATVKEIRGDLRWWNNIIWENDGTKMIIQKRFKECPDKLIKLEELISGIGSDDGS